MVDACSIAAMKKVAVLGSGVVGETLAAGFMKHGHEVMRASREPAKLADWKAKAGDKAQTGTFAEAAKWGDIIVLCVKGDAALSAMELAGPENTAGKTVIDTTNPIAGAPENGVIPYFTKMDESLMEMLQKANPRANLVKCFSSVGSPRMVNPDFGGTKPTMFICGDNDGAKADVKGILDAFGWETADMGGVTAARAIEPLCILWCIPGFREKSWTHAFKLLR
jgi:predicted dinucleotide-binding enzyme